MKQPKRLFIRIRMRMSLRTISSSVLRTPPRVTYLWGLALDAAGRSLCA